MDLDDDEKEAFGQWQDVPYYVGVLHNTNLPDFTNFYNLDLLAPYTLPHDRFVKGIDSAGFAGYQTVAVIGERDSNAAQKLVKTAIAHAHVLFGLLSSGRFELSTWKQHDNLGLHVSPDAVKNGFYSKLYQLQGRRSTFYTGNAWCADYSSLLWAFTEKRILPSLLK